MVNTVAGPQASVVDLRVQQGATFVADFLWSENDVPQSLVGAQFARLGVARRAGADLIFQVDSTAGEIELEPLDDAGAAQVGVVRVTMSADKTELLTSKGAYDLIVVFPDRVIRMYEGAILTDRRVTPKG